MDAFYRSLILGDSGIRQWAHEIVEYVGERLGDEYADPEELHEAIDQPMLFVQEMQEGDDRLYDSFVHCLSLIEKETRGDSDPIARKLLLRRQPFVRRLKVFDEISMGALKHSIRGVAKRFHVHPPSDDDLKFQYPDIVRGASMVRGYIDALRDMALRKGLRNYLEEADEELEKIAENLEAYDSADARRRIWEVEWMAAGATALLNLDEVVFARRAREIADGLDQLRNSVPEARMSEVISLIKAIRACLDGGAIDGRVRDMVVEAHIITADLLFGDEHRLHGGKAVVVKPRFDDVSSFAFAFIEMGNPHEAVRLINRITRNSALAGAALLDASYRYRLRHTSSPLLEVIPPILKRAQLVRVKPGRANGEGIPADFDLGDADFLREFPGYIDEWRPIHLEFGGGWTPVGLKMASGLDDSWFISIDPNPKPVLDKFGYKGEFPRNFVPLVGRAEDVAPFAALGSFAEDVVMVSPPAANLNSMLLSALLAVKPGGAISIYLNADQASDVGWVEEAGLDIVEMLLDSDDPTLPDSDCLTKYGAVRYLRVSVGDLEIDGGNAPGRRGKGFEGIARLGDVNGENGGNSDIDVVDRTMIQESDADKIAEGQSMNAVLAAATMAGFGALKKI